MNSVFFKNRLVAISIILILLSSTSTIPVDAAPVISVGKEPKILADEQNITDFQLQLKKSIDTLKTKKKAVKKAVPEVSFIADSKFVGDQLVVTGKTILTYSGPEQAGLESWPDFVVESDDSFNPKDYMKTSNLKIEGTINEGDYTQMVIDAFPEIYNNEEYGPVVYGKEKRIITLEETITYDVPVHTVFNKELEMSIDFDGIVRPDSPEMESPIGPSILTKSKVVMGFTVNPTPIDYSIYKKIEVCVPFTSWCATALEGQAGFQFHYSLGLRLPAEVTVVTLLSFLFLMYQLIF